MRRSFSLNSKSWLARQAKDVFAKEAKSQGLRSRSSFKLKEINEKHRIIRRNSFVVDLGSAPGGWSLYCSQEIDTASGGYICAVDLLPMAPVPKTAFLQGDFNQKAVQEFILNACQGRRADVILSDMLHNTTGHRSTDQCRSINLCTDVLHFSTAFLCDGGTLLMKFLRCNEDRELMQEMRRHFGMVKVIKPEASRQESAEAYFLAQNYKRLPATVYQLSPNTRA